MKSAAMVFGAVVLLITACLLIGVFAFIDNDEGEVDENDALIEVGDNDVTIVVTSVVVPVVPTDAPIQPVDPVVSVQIVPTSRIVTTCQARSDWLTYIVQAGDTIATIATATGSTTNDLALANCLPNPDAIYVGQQLYVPALPVVNAVVPANINYTLTIDPAITFQNNTYTLRGGRAVRIILMEIPADATAVDFFLTQTGALNPALITRDEDLTDGAFVSWTVPQPATGVVHAVITLANGTQVQSSSVNVVTQ